MRLLIVTQKVDFYDDNLGFFHQWIKKFSEKLEKLYVICLWKGEYYLPDNVKVYSLGKERRLSKLGQLFRLQKFLLKHLSEVNGIFVHMCPIYAVVSFPLVKIFNKQLILWYAHGAVGFWLELAEKLVDKILTPSLASCRLKSKKIKVLGHGIDTEKFKIRNSIPIDKQAEFKIHSKFRILSVGRISPIKDQETLIRAIDVLVNQKNLKNIEVKFIGTPIDEKERRYSEDIKKLIQEKKLEHYFIFLGSLSHEEMPKYYQTSNLLVNTSQTGSLDKVVLEAMASGCLILSCNEAYQKILPDKYLFEKKNYHDLAKKIINLMEAKQEEGDLRKIVVKNHNLDSLIKKIILEMSQP